MKCCANLHVATDAAAVRGPGFVQFPFSFENGLHTRHEDSLCNFSQSMKKSAHWLCTRRYSYITRNTVVFSNARILFLPDEEEAFAPVIVCLFLFDMT